MNYLGYRIGGEIQAVLDDTEIGNLQIVIGNNTFEEGFIDTSTSQKLPIADYPEFYSKFGTQYGYVEKIITVNELSGTIQVGMRVSQTAVAGVQYTGSVAEIGYKTLLILKEPNSPQVSLSKNLIVDPGGQNLQYAIDSASVYATQTPIIRLPQPLLIETAYGTPAPNQRVSVGLKVQPMGIRVSVPSNILANTVTADSVIVGNEDTNVETVLDDHEARIQTIEDRLRI
jgi:hypothetical protein